MGNIENLRNAEVKPNRKTNNKEDKERKISRRSFLKIAALTTAGVLAKPSVLSVDDISKLFNKKKESGSDKKDEVIKEDIRLEVNEDGKRINKKEEEMNESEKIVSEVFRVYKTDAVQRRFDKEVFTKDFFMAQEFQESRGLDEAESDDGLAKGPCQNRPESTQQVIEYLSFLKEETKGLSDEKRIDYYGPNKIGYHDADKIGDLYKKYKDYGRAARALYLLSIYDKDVAYNTKNRDVFRGEAPEKQQELLLISYRVGPTNRLHPEKAGTEAKDYVKKIRFFMKQIKDLRAKLEYAGMSKDLDEAIFAILREFDRPKSEDNLEEVKLSCLKKLQEAHIKKWRRTGSTEDKLSNEEIRAIFS